MAGIVAIAFVIARTGQWLNESMVERNENFQATRVAAGRSDRLEGFAAPPELHLIGPGSGRTGGLGPPGPGPGAAACRDGADLLSQAAVLRRTAERMLASSDQWRTRTQQTISDHHARAKLLISFANTLLANKERVDRYNREIAESEETIRTEYSTYKDLLAEFMAEAGLTSAEELQDAWREVDERLEFLNRRIGQYNTQIRELQAITTTYINPKLAEINNLLSRDADGPEGTRYEWPTGIVRRIGEIDRALAALDGDLDAMDERLEEIRVALEEDADGSGPLTVGINQRITDIQDRLAEIPNELIACGADVACADALIAEADALRLELEGDPSADPPIDGWLDIKADLLDERGDLLDEQAATSGSKDDLEYERNVEPHVVEGVEIPGVEITVPDSAVEDLDALTIPDAENVPGLVGQAEALEALRTALTEYWTDEINPRVQDLIAERKPFMDEKAVLDRINRAQYQIEWREWQKQAIKNNWCGFSYRSDPAVERYVQSAVAHCAGDSGLDCAVTGPASPVLTHPIVSDWQASLAPLSTNPDSAAPGSGFLACAAHQVKGAADTEFTKANNLVDSDLKEESKSIQQLLDDAEDLERRAREACASM